MHVADLYHDKTVAILSVDSIVSKITLRKLMLLAGDRLEGVYLIDTHGRPENPSKDINKNSLLEQDAFFKGVFSHQLLKKVKFISMFEKDSEKHPQAKLKVDILLNCYVPQDFTRNSVQKFLGAHVFKTKQICDFLSARLQISKMIALSSIYCHNYGFVSQSDGQINLQPLGYSPESIASVAKLKQNLQDIFTSDYEIWQWSVLFMQNLYAVQAGSRATEVVRLPLMGPTLENFEGYSSRFNTLTSVIYEIGSRQIDALEGNMNNIVDMIPADFVAHYMLTVAVIALEDRVIAESGGESQPHLETGSKFKIIVHNLSTSSRNPISLARFGGYVLEAWLEYTPDYVKKANLKINEKKWERKAYKIQEKLPNTAKARLAHLFDFKSWKIESQQQEIKSNKKIETMRKYRQFLEHEWICESNKSIDYFCALSSEDQARLNFNVNSINWKTYSKLCCYSIQKHLLGVEVEKFNAGNMDLLHLQKSSYFSDIVWALTAGKITSTQTAQEIKNYVLSTKSVKEAVRQLVEEQSRKLEQTPMAYEKMEEEFYRVADQMCTQMFSQYSMGSIRGFAWFLHKVFRTIYDKVVVDKNAIMKIKNRDEKTSGPLIIIPTHRSYIDFLIMSYVFFVNGIKVPHIAAAEDFLNMAIVHVLLRKSGAFFIKRDQKKFKNLYKAIMTEYISKLLVENQYLQFFIEGTRSRVGKMLEPKYGILSIISRNVLDGKIPDAQILPVTINYEKILQGTSYTYELMGETKVKESLSRLIKAVDVLKENYGRIYLQLCEPISVKQYFATVYPQFAHKPDQQYELTLNQLGYRIVYELTDKLVITAPAILASIILMDRIGISDDRLSEKAKWLCEEITSRGIKVARTQSDSSISILNTLGLMGDVVNKSKKDMFEVQVSFNQNSFIQLFTLTSYRNSLTHIFFEQALVAVSMAGFGYQNMFNCKVPLQDLRESTMFLAKLLKKQFVLNNYLADNPARFGEVLEKMASRDIIQTKGEQADNNMTRIMTGISNPESNIFMFYCSLIWPVVESYWICVLYLFKLARDKRSMETPKLLSEIQWFGQSIFTERIILHLEAISMDTIKNAVAVLKASKIITESTEADRKVVRVTAGEEDLRLLQRRIEKYLKTKYASSFKGSLGNSRGLVSIDFPFLSKL